MIGEKTLNTDQVSKLYLKFIKKEIAGILKLLIKEFIIFFIMVLLT